MKINTTQPQPRPPVAAKLKKMASVVMKCDVYGREKGSVVIPPARIVTRVFGGTAHQGVQSKEKGSELSAMPSSSPRQ